MRDNFFSFKNFILCPQSDLTKKKQNKKGELIGRSEGMEKRIKQKDDSALEQKKVTLLFQKKEKKKNENSNSIANI